MNIKKGFILVAGISMLLVLIMSVGLLNMPAQAADEPPAEVDSDEPEQDLLVSANTPDADGMLAI